MVESGVRPDGRYLTAEGGGELCYLWNRSSSGCGETCRQGRQHQCEWCRGPHRAVDDSCPSKKRPQGWRPDPVTPKGQGRGKLR